MVLPRVYGGLARAVTYEPVLKSGTAFPTYPGVKNYVFSRTLKESSDANVELIREAANLLQICHYSTGKFPRRRVQVYEEGIETLLSRWDASKNVSRHYFGLSVQQKREPGLTQDAEL
jgi:hypothetical protein